ncbi:Retrovirus-related Pol polyprotein from transposon RE1 [Sesamum angolense]|uniref:Retrovirus-related Pol polyprotein from transposon RE1 n=1 Tax=Sesamum angolense TaxID=2727404 RepID=A0AAE1W0H1_9LAMI|nr:Retrovirus-related Pol polyprotein from transposon RE1 [Sesamum angolense]
MVTSWILNFNSKEIVESFLYVNSAGELWKELETHFGESNWANGLLDTKGNRFSLTRRLVDFSILCRAQEVMDDLTCLKPLPQCECGASKIIAYINLSNQLMQFLMGLHDNYDHTIAMQARDNRRNRNFAPKFGQRKKTQAEKQNMDHKTKEIVDELRFYAQPTKHPEWINAMKAEIQALESNKTWDITSLPEGKNAIGCKWVYKLKLKPNGMIDRYKARLVAIGYNQVEGVDFMESFSSVAQVVTVRSLLAVAASKGWYIHQLDVNNAFLHGYLDEEIYMDAPEGYPVPPGHVCKLQKSLYGPSESHISEVKSYLDSLFTIKDLGTAKYFLALEIARAPEGLALTQSKYIKDILQDMGSQTAKPTTTPLPAGIKFSAQQTVHFPSQQYTEDWYLKGTLQKGLFFPSGTPLNLKAYCDADWASCMDTRRSLTGYCIFLGPALISWKTKKQSTVSRSTRAMGSTACELTWIYALLQDLQMCIPKPIQFLCDNRASLHIMSNPVFHEQTKHLEIDCHLVWDHYETGFLAPSHVSSKDQLAGVFTKPLTRTLFQSLVCKLGLIDFAPCPA